MKKQKNFTSLVLGGVVLFLLSSCSPNYLKFSISLAPLKINEQKTEPISDANRKNNVLKQMTKDMVDALSLKDEKLNNIFSPTSFFQCVGEVALASKNGFQYVTDLGYTSLSQFKDDFDALQKYFLFESDYTYLKLLGFYCLYNIDKPNLEVLNNLASKSNLSSFNFNDAKDLISTANEYLNVNAGIDFKIPESIIERYEKAVFAVNGLHIKDSFRHEKEIIQSNFTDLNGTTNKKDFIEFENYGHIYRDDNNKVFLFDASVAYSRLIYVLPFEGTNINDIDLNNIDLFSFNKNNNVNPKQFKITAPLFSNETEFDNYDTLLKNYHISVETAPFNNITDDVFAEPEMFAYQKNKFELTNKGIEGKAVTIIGEGATSSAPMPDDATEIIVDRPFYCLSMFGDYPLFINKITNL